MSLEGVGTPGCFAFEVGAQRQPCELTRCLYFLVLALQFHASRFTYCATSPSLPQSGLTLMSALFPGFPLSAIKKLLAPC